MSGTPGDTFRTGEVGVGAIAPLLPFAGVVNQELSHFPQGAPFFAGIDDDASAPPIVRF